MPIVVIQAAVHMVGTILKGLIFPAVFVGSLAAFQGLQAIGAAPPVALLCMTVGNLAVVAGLEAVFPLRREWAWWKDGQTINDLVHGALLTLIGSRLGEAAFSSFVASAMAALASSGGVWPHALPLSAQVALAIFVTDFFDAAKHWIYHNAPLTWPIHALHHAPDRMHVAKGARLHFLEATIRYGVITAPLLIAGAGPEIIFWHAAVMNALGNLNHSNVDMPLPRPLHYLLATPQVHRLHHSIDPELGRCNLSPGFMFPDHLFGTFRDPVSHRLGSVGVAADPIQGNLLVQILSPAIWPVLVLRQRLSKRDGAGMR